jgi:hypothetical protein
MAERTATRRFPSGAQTIIGRALFPSAYAPYDKWSSDIFEKRLSARLEAQKLMREDPERAFKILGTIRAEEIERQAKQARAALKAAERTASGEQEMKS